MTIEDAVQLAEIESRFKEAVEWGERCAFDRGDFAEGMYPREYLPGDLAFLIEMARRVP